MQQRRSKILHLDIFGIPQHCVLKVLASRPKSEEAVAVPAPLALCHQSMYPPSPQLGVQSSRMTLAVLWHSRPVLQDGHEAPGGSRTHRSTLGCALK